MVAIKDVAADFIKAKVSIFKYKLVGRKWLCHHRKTAVKTAYIKARNTDKHLFWVFVGVKGQTE